MPDFADYWQTLDQNALRLQIDSQSPADVERALTCHKPGITELMALLSPRLNSIWNLWQRKLCN
ncbi:2-iminoacetate synthase [Tatumella ptyseos]|uniref:2-iminoacetate synthase n=1 Tax=Tatumella ptyseos TaxID=82987 RepID=A0A2X5QZ71_9GAMM|nr:2-iminoacetate synthase [Tatumella ptyseos]